MNTKTMIALTYKVGHCYLMHYNLPETRKVKILDLAGSCIITAKDCSSGEIYTFDATKFTYNNFRNSFELDCRGC